MGFLFDQMKLRQSPEFRDYIMSAVLHCAGMVQAEPVETEFHDARVKMADLITDTNDPKVDAFTTKIVATAITHAPIRETVVVEGDISIRRADDGAVISGILFLWNETTLAVWPDILDVEPGA